MKDKKQLWVWAMASTVLTVLAWAAAWDPAGAELRHTVEKLQQSALELVERMIALQDEEPVHANPAE
jgi:hypothetical protein